MTTHTHSMATYRQTHTFKTDGYERMVHTCSCGAYRVLTRKKSTDISMINGFERSEWAHMEAMRAA